MILLFSSTAAVPLCILTRFNNVVQLLLRSLRLFLLILCEVLAFVI